MDEHNECTLHSWSSTTPNKVCPHCNALQAEVERLRTENRAMMDRYQRVKTWYEHEWHLPRGAAYTPPWEKK